MSEHIPTVGRTVHYVLKPGDVDTETIGCHRAAIVTEIPVSGGLYVNLTVFLDLASDGHDRLHLFSVAYSSEGDQGSWHWPERS